MAGREILVDILTADAAMTFVLEYLGAYLTAAMAVGIPVVLRSGYHVTRRGESSSRIGLIGAT